MSVIRYLDGHIISLDPIYKGKAMEICSTCESELQWGQCPSCGIRAYSIFGKYGYEFIPHSGGLVPIVKVSGELTEEEDKLVESYTWQKRDSFYNRINETVYCGPWGCYGGISLWPEERDISDYFTIEKIED
jgi:hypothetical protein